MRTPSTGVQLRFGSSSTAIELKNGDESSVRISRNIYRELNLDKEEEEANEVEEKGFWICVKLDERYGRVNWDERRRGESRRRDGEWVDGWTVLHAVVDETLIEDEVLLDASLRELWFFTHMHNDASSSFIPAKVVLHHPITLSRLVIQSTSQESLSLEELVQHLGREFSTPILRQGSTIKVPKEQEKLDFRILLTSPVLQGMVRLGRTEVILVPLEVKEEEEESNLSNGNITLGPASLVSFSSHLSSSTKQQHQEERLYNFDADAFLSSSLGISGDDTDQSHDENQSLYDDGLSESERDTNSMLLSSGQTTPKQWDSPVLAGSEWEEKVSQRSQENGREKNGKTRKLTFQALVLDRRPVDLSDSSGNGASKQEKDELDEDDEARCWLTLAGMAGAGLFSGDWVFLMVEEGTSATISRLARVGVLDEAEYRNLLEEDMQHMPIYLPPTLLHNLVGKTGSPIKRINVHLSPIPSSNRTPPLPVAKSIMLARIASPHSVESRYENQFSAGLRDHFEDEKRPIRRILRRGDVVAVPIDSSEGLEAANMSASLTDEDESVARTMDALVFFTVTYIGYDPLSSLQEDFHSSISSMCRAGELGCWIDSSVTKMATVGLEHGRGLTGRKGWWNIGGPRHKPYSASAEEKLSQILAVANKVPSLQLPILLKGARGSGKASLARSVAEAHGQHIIEIDCFTVLGDSAVKTIANLKVAVEKANSCAPAVLLLRHVEALGKKEENQRVGKDSANVSALAALLRSNSIGQTAWPVVVIGTTSDETQLPQTTLALFKVELELKAPSEGERLAIFQNLLDMGSTAPDVDRRALAAQTAGLQARDLDKIVAGARQLALADALRSEVNATSGINDESASFAGLQLAAKHLEASLSEARVSFADSIGAPKIPNVSWDDVGGLASVKQDILDTVQLPLERPELFATGLKKRSGILLYGPPGTGKTLLAKAVATSCSLNFFSVKGPELLNMYIGESEANVRRVFQRARDAQPCVIFMDELDSIAPKRGNQGDSGGVMDRIVSQLLAELDGMSEGQDGPGVFVMAATNRPDLLDSSLLRPGRFDRMLYLSVSTDHESQYRIMEALTRKFKLSADLNLRDIAEQCPFNYTGADFYALCSDAMLKAMSRVAGQVDVKIAAFNSAPGLHSFPSPLTPQYYLAEMASPSELEVYVGRGDFEAALREMVPSVSEAEMQHYETVQKQFSQETINGLAEPSVSATKGKGKGKGKA